MKQLSQIPEQFLRWFQHPSRYLPKMTKPPRSGEPLSTCRADKALSRICSTEGRLRVALWEQRERWPNTERASDISRRRAMKFGFESSKASSRAVASPSVASSSSVALTAFKLHHRESTALSWENQHVSLARFSFNLDSFNTCCISQSSAAWVVL